MSHPTTQQQRWLSSRPHCMGLGVGIREGAFGICILILFRKFICLDEHKNDGKNCGAAENDGSQNRDSLYRSNRQFCLECTMMAFRLTLAPLPSPSPHHFSQPHNRYCFSPQKSKQTPKEPIRYSVAAVLVRTFRPAVSINRFRSFMHRYIYILIGNAKFTIDMGIFR